jgi:hypothetical protein
MVGFLPLDHFPIYEWGCGMKWVMAYRWKNIEGAVLPDKPVEALSIRKILQSGRTRSMEIICSYREVAWDDFMTYSGYTLHCKLISIYVFPEIKELRGLSPNFHIHVSVSDLQYVFQGVTKRCRLSWLTNNALVNEPKCGGGEGRSCGVPANEYSCTQEPK